MVPGTGNQNTIIISIIQNLIGIMEAALCGIILWEPATSLLILIIQGTDFDFSNQSKSVSI